MNFLAVLGVVAALVMLCMGALCLAFSRAPGWKSYRVFSAIAFLLSMYAMISAIGSIPGQTLLTGSLLPRVNGAIDLCMVALWLDFSHRCKGRRLERFDRLLTRALVLSASVMLIPGAGIAEAHRVYLPSLGLDNIAITFTLPGDLMFAIGCVAIVYVLLGFLGLTKQGALKDKFGALGFLLLTLMTLEDVLVADYQWQWPYLGSLGFAGVIVFFAADMSARVSRDVTALRDLNRDLKAQMKLGGEKLAVARASLLVAERHAALGQLASSVGHGINEPLSNVGGNLCYLRDYRGAHRWHQEEAEAIEEALIGVLRITQIVRDLTAFGASPSGETEVADVERALSSALRIIESRYRGRVEFHADSKLCGNVEMRESKLTQVLTNVLSNAADASIAGSISIVSVRCGREEENLIVEVSDRGEGVADADLPHVFDPLFTTKPIGSGVGLGLFVCRGIIEDAGGTIVLSSAQGAGTTARISLPFTNKASTAKAGNSLAATILSASAATAPSTRSSGPAAARRIYLIDDDPMFTRAVVRMLGDVEVIVENDSARALRHLKGHGSEYDVIVCDLMMPQVSGMQIYEHLTAKQPEVAERLVFVTGGAITSRAEAFAGRSDIICLRKPLMSEVLRTALEQVGFARRSPVDPGIS